MRATPSHSRQSPESRSSSFAAMVSSRYLSEGLGSIRASLRGRHELRRSRLLRGLRGELARFLAEGVQLREQLALLVLVDLHLPHEVAEGAGGLVVLLRDGAQRTRDASQRRGSPRR